MHKILIASFAIGVGDVGGIYLLQHFGMLITSSSLLAWALAGLILWIATFAFGLHRWGARTLWSLIGLPLVLFPFSVLVMGAGL
jgi:hypothetical protein